MGIMSGIGKLLSPLSPNDPELVEKTLARIAEQDTWNDVFSTKLIELLDNIDLLKSEVRQELRAVESATQSASASLKRAEIAQKQAAQTTLEAKKALDESTRQLDRVREHAEEAGRQMRAAEARLISSDRNLQKARELERIAEQKQLSAVSLLRAAMWYSASAVAASWIAMFWLAWIVFRPALPAWVAGIASAALLVGAALFPRLVKHEA